MIFSALKWDNGKEIKEFVNVSTALSFAKMGTSLRNAYSVYFLPLFGPDMLTRLEEIYTTAAEERTSIETAVLASAQSANANLAFFIDFDEMNVRISDAGIQRPDKEDYKTMYKYQENNLRRSFRNKGFNELDNLISILEKEVTLFPEFESSTAYVESQKSIVPNATVANEYYFIASSRIVFLRMQPHLKFVEETLLQQTLGSGLYTLLNSMLNGGGTDDQRVYIETLRNACSRVLVLESVRRLMLDGGSLTDRGLYFSEQKATSDNDIAEIKADGTNLAMQLDQLAADVKSAVARLANLAKTLYPEFSPANPHSAYDRDNDLKKTFFA